MGKKKKGKKKGEVMRDEEATPLDWFIVECLVKRVLGDAYEIRLPKKDKRNNEKNSDGKRN
jgi:hypothetical protein